MKWISVKDRLPENDIPVIVCSKSGIVQEVLYCLDIKKQWYANHIEDSEISFDYFTYWMPLPESPKEQK
jgi:glucose-6-phosphate isomerase